MENKVYVLVSLGLEEQHVSEFFGFLFFLLPHIYPKQYSGEVHSPEKPTSAEKMLNNNVKYYYYSYITFLK